MSHLVSVIFDNLVARQVIRRGGQSKNELQFRFVSTGKMMSKHCPEHP